MSKHTPGPWSQGTTLMTGQTKNWTPEQIEENNRRERRMVFSRFSAEDKGRSRVMVALCDREEDAERIVACVEACKGIGTESLQRFATEHLPKHGFGVHRESELEAQRDKLLDALNGLVLFTTPKKSNAVALNRAIQALQACGVRS